MRNVLGVCHVEIFRAPLEVDSQHGYIYMIEGFFIIQRLCAEEVEPPPCASRRGKGHKIAVTPGRSLLMARLVCLEDGGVPHAADDLAHVFKIV